MIQLPNATLVAAGLALLAAPAQEELEILADYVAAQFRADGPGGVVLVARGDELLLHAAYGLADVSTGRPLRVDQPLPIGSLTKSFTAAAILRLAADGVLTLDEDVRESVPDAPVGAHRVRIEQLLTHTSGMPSLVDVPGFDAWGRQPRSTAELLAQTSGKPFLFEPGTGFAYSDSGYILLGAVLESRRGTTWFEAVHELVAGPLGLESVEFAEALGDRAAVGYELAGARFVVPEAYDWSVPHASGSLVATAHDLLRWVRAWKTEAIAPAELMAGAWAARDLPDGTRSGYGYGWKRCDFEGRQAIQHGGWVPGFTASVLHLPEEDLTSIVLSNACEDVESTYVARRALRLLLTGAPDPLACELSRSQRDALTGRYRTEQGATWTISARDSTLFLDQGYGPVELIALSPRVLSAADSDGCWCFTFELREGDGAASVTASLTCEPQARALRIE